MLKGACVSTETRRFGFVVCHASIYFVAGLCSHFECLQCTPPHQYMS